MSRRKIVLLFFGFLVMLLGTTFVVLQETGASTAFVERALARFIRGEFDLKEAIIDLARGTITLENFRLSRPGVGQDPIVEVERVEVGVITNPLGDVLTVGEMKFEGMTMTLDLGKGLPDPEELLTIPAQTQPAVGGSGGPATYPPVVIADSQVQLRVSPNLPPILFTDVNLQLVPENPNSSRMTLSGTLRASAGIDLDLEVQGTADPDKREFRAVVQAADIALQPELARLVQPDLESELRSMGVEGNIDLLSLWIEYPSPALGDDEEPVLRGGVTAELSDLDMVVPQFPYPLLGSTAKFSASTRDGGSLKFDLKSQSASGDVDVVGALTNYLSDNPVVDVRVRGHDLLVGVDLREAVARQPVAETVWQAFEPDAGRVDVDFHLTNSDDDPMTRIEMDLALAGVGATFHGFESRPGQRRIAFPLPLRNAVGRVRLRDNLLTIENLQALVDEEAGGGQVMIDGFLVVNGDPRANLDITGTGVQFSEHMRRAVDALVPDGGAIFDEYGPRGVANVNVRIRPDANSGMPGYQVQILPLDASASFRGFPYRVGGIGGSVRIEPDGVTFDLSGGEGSSSVDLRGRFVRTGDQRRLRSELWVEAHGVAADEKLRAALGAMSPELEDLWQYLSPDGLADCELSLWKSVEAEKPSFDLRIDVQDGTAQLANFPIPLTNLAGSLFVHGTPEGRRTDVSTIRGMIDNGPGLEPATFLLLGNVLRGDAESLDLTAVVRNLELTRDLAVALDHNGAFRLSTWDILKPSGTVDVALRQNQAAGAEKPDQFLRVWLKDVRSDAAMLPQPATHISGEVNVFNGEASFGASSDPLLPGESTGILQGRMGAAEIRCLEGRVKRDNGETKVNLTVASEEFPVDANLANLMKGPLQKAYLDRNMKGSMSVPALTLEFTFPEEAANFTTRLSGEVWARGVSMKLGTRIESISGALLVEEAIVGPGQGHVDGHLHDMSFRIVGHDCHGFQASYHADASRLQIGLPTDGGPNDVPDLSLNLHGGTIEGRRGTETALQYEYRDGGVLTLDASFNGLSLSDFLRSSGFVGNPFRGTVSGELQLEELTGADFVNMRANGKMRITDADLGAVPAFTSIYAYMAPARRPRFDGAFVDFEVGNRRVSFNSIEVGSPLLDVSGDGTMTMDGYLDMNLWVPNLLGDDADWLVLPQIIHQITSRVVQFDVFGYLRNTSVQPRLPWASTPSRQDILPIPAARRQKTARRRY